MHHSTDRIAHTTVFLTPVVEQWLEPKIVNGSTTKDRSGDPWHNEQMLYHGATSCICLISNSGFQSDYKKIITLIDEGNLIRYDNWMLLICPKLRFNPF